MISHILIWPKYSRPLLSLHPASVASQYCSVLIMVSFLPLGVTFVLFAGLASGVVIKTKKCFLPAERQKACTVHEVRLDPCPQAGEDKPCQIQLGSNVSLSFDYTTTFSSEKVESQASKVGTNIDMHFEDMDIDACKYTACPLEANKKQTYTYSLQLGNKYPAGVHQVKWKLWDNPDYTKQCCFKFPIQLIN